MRPIEAKAINNFLFDFSNGFLMKYRLGKGIDGNLLEEFYEILEQLRLRWKGKEEVEKEIIYELVSVVPGLYCDLAIYEEHKDFEEYKNILLRLEIAISMCLNPNSDDPSFDIPLNNKLAI